MEHGEVKVVCGGFSKPPKTSPYRDLLDPAGSADLQRIAANFTFTRVQASALVQQASDCFDAWSAVRKTSDANVFLLSLLMRKHWDKPR